MKYEIKLLKMENNLYTYLQLIIDMMIFLKLDIQKILLKDYVHIILEE